MIPVKYNAFTVFLVVFTAFCFTGCIAGPESTTSTVTFVEDDVFSDTHAFDPLFNLVDFRENLPKRRQHPEKGTHLFWEAEDLVHIATLVDTEWTRRAAAWPLFHAAVICMPGPNRVCASRWSIDTPAVTPAQAGPHRLWIRRVQWRQIPAPIVVRVLQGTNIVAQETLGGEVDDVDPFQGRIVWDPVDATLDGSPVRIEIEKPKDEAVAGDRIVDALYLTSDLGYTPVGRTQLPSRDILREQAALVGRGKKVVVWPAEEPWITFGIHDWPTGGELTTRVQIEACQDEREPALVRLTSMVDDPLMLNMSAGPLEDARGRSYAAPEVRVVGFLSTIRYGWQPLPLLRRRAVGLAPYHTAGLWITVDTHGLPPGNYHSPITLSGDGATETIDVHLTVHPIRIPLDPEFWSFIWGGPPEAPPGVDRMAVYLRDLMAHGVNWLYHTELALEHADLVKELGFVAGSGRGVDWGFTIYNKEYETEAYRKTIADGHEELRQRAEKYGFDEKHFASILIDEPPLDDHWFNVYTVAKEIGGAATFINPGGVVTPEAAKRFLPIIDIWCPYEWALHVPETMEILKSGPGKVTFYNHFTQDATNPAKSWTWFRRMQWRAWKHRLDGVGFYCYSCGDGNPWNDHDGTNDAGPGQYVVVYPGTRGAIPTPQWEVWREGREDRDRLDVLQKAIDDARARGDDAAADQAQAVMRWAVDKALNANSPADFSRANERVIQAILELR